MRQICSPSEKQAGAGEEFLTVGDSVCGLGHLPEQ